MDKNKKLRLKTKVTFLNHKGREQRNIKLKFTLEFKGKTGLWLPVIQAPTFTKLMKTIEEKSKQHNIKKWRISKHVIMEVNEPLFEVTTR